MKEILSALFACTLALALLAACEKAPATSDPSGANLSGKPTDGSSASSTSSLPHHCHMSSSGWNVDLNNHWQVCGDCGDSFGTEAHTLEDGWCTVCAAEFYTFDMNDTDYTAVCIYDDQGNTVLELQYNADGILEISLRREYTYDASGNVLVLKEYTDDALSYEVEYAPDADGIPCAVKDTIYWEDGSKEYCEYDQNGSPLLMISYDADGQVLYHNRYAYTYDAEGNILTQKNYENDILVSEYEYAVYADVDYSYTYTVKETIYYEDGSKLILEYNENFEIISESYFDAEGNPADHSSKFDPALCQPLYGNWQGQWAMDGAIFGVSFDIRYNMTMSFDDQGNMLTSMTVNEEDIKALTVEMIYATYGDFGMTRAEIDAYFQSEIGMTVAEYADQSLQEDETALQPTQEANVYYVEGDQLYAGSSWTAYMEPIQFALEGDTLTLTYVDDYLSSTVYTLYRSAE